VVAHANDGDGDDSWSLSQLLRRPKRMKTSGGGAAEKLGPNVAMVADGGFVAKDDEFVDDDKQFVVDVELPVTWPPNYLGHNRRSVFSH